MKLLRRVAVTLVPYGVAVAAAWESGSVGIGLTTLLCGWVVMWLWIDFTDRKR